MHFGLTSRMGWAILIATVVLAVAYSGLSIWRHEHFLSHGHDLGIFDQALWHLSHSHVPAITIRKIPIGNIFGDHFHPLLLLIVPFYWIWSSPVVLLMVQGLLFASVLPLTYALARTMKLRSDTALILATAMGLHPGLWLAANFDFHEVAFAAPLIIAAALGAIRQKWWYWLALVGMIFTKESLALYTALFGLVLILRRDWRRGAITFVIGLIAFFLITKMIIPALAGEHGFAYWDQYRDLAASPAQLPLAALEHPLRFFFAFFDQAEKLRTAGILFLSVLGLPLLSWTMWPMMVMAFAERFLSNQPGLWSLQFHYQVILVGIFAVAIVFALHDRRRWFSPPVSRIIAIGIFVAVVCTNWWLHVWQPSPANQATAQASTQWARDLQVIPASDAVSAQDAFVSHLAHRQLIYQFPRVREATWIILDPRAPSWPLTSDEVRGWEQSLSTNPAWRIARADGTLMVFQRVAKNNDGLPTDPDWQ